MLMLSAFGATGAFANGRAIVRSELVFETAPFASAHASTIVETKDGLVAAWFGGTREGAPDVGIWLSRREDGTWTPPVEVATGVQPDGARYPCWNPVLAASRDKGLMLFYKVGPSPQRWWGMVRRSHDGGRTWSEARRLPADVLGPIKNKPVWLADGTLIAPSSTESPERPSRWRVHFERSADAGATWTVARPSDAVGGPQIDAIQPSILTHTDGRLQAVGRTRSGRIFETWSTDGGETWSPLALTGLPNPNAGIDAVTLRDGRHLIVYNHTPEGRSPLNVSVSNDGRTWEPLLVLESDPGEYSYPAVIEGADGLVHVTYTWKRERIKHVVIDPAQVKPAGQRWTPQRAAAWQKEQGWLVGANFIPSTAINQLEMWQAETFDPKTIDRELGWARDLGFNSMRVFLHDLLWKQDSAGFLRRVDQFLAIAEKHRIGVMLVLLDGVWDPHPKLGSQPAPKPHVHNSGWVQSPGAEILGDPRRHEELRPYVQGVLRHFGTDRRVHAWDLFNEPDNRNVDAYGARELPNKEEMALTLLQRVFAWARQVNPDQPLTVGPWREEDFTDAGPATPVGRFALEESDVISFHAYTDAAGLTKRIDVLRKYRRPLLCTEYLARSFGSTIQAVLPVMKTSEVAAYTWGLVAGKTQTIYPWSSWTKPFTAEPAVWHHDLFRKDGTPYDAAEVKLIRSLTTRK